MESNYYEILGVRKSATEEEIKIAFKSLAKKFHPDKNPDNKLYEEQFKKINEAYQTLSNSSKRFLYDIKLENSTVTHQAQARPTPPKPAFKKKTKEEYLKEKALEKKIIWMTSAGIVVVLMAGYFLYLFMNRYTSQVLIEEGIEFESNKAYIAALEKYSEAMGYDKENPEAYTRRGLLRVKIIGDIQGGISDLTLAVKYSDDKDFKVYYNRAQIYVMAQEYKDALKDLGSCIAVKPDYDSAYYSIAEIENKFLFNCKNAMLKYSKTLELNPKFGEAYIGQSLCLIKDKKITLAIETLNKALALDGTKGEWYFYRGECYILKNKKKNACKDYAKALENGYSPAEKKIQKYCW